MLLTNRITHASTDQDDISHGYLSIVEPDKHKNVLTMELLEFCSNHFRTPVLFKSMVPLDPKVASRKFLEVNVDQKLIWRRKDGDSPVAFRNANAENDYNYVSGQEGTAQEYLDEIFERKNDVYAHLGYISSGFGDLYKYPWGVTIFEHVRDTVFQTGWFHIPEWKLTGHVFLGNNTEMYGEPSKGAPGSDWHMFPTANLFVMLAGKKKWMTYPPQPGDQLRNQEELIYPSGGREGPVEEREYDTVYVEPGDVLFNVPYEWHKVVNAEGWSLGAAFRVIDRSYIDHLISVPAVATNIKIRKLDEDEAHLATSLRLASHDPSRLQMFLNTAEMMICESARYSFLKKMVTRQSRNK